jgi:hypothetical protein
MATTTNGQWTSYTSIARKLNEADIAEALAYLQNVENRDKSNDAIALSLLEATQTLLTPKELNIITANVEKNHLLKEYPDLYSRINSMKTQNNKIPAEITADEFFKLSAAQRASLPEGLTIVGDLNLGIGARNILPIDLATLKLPDNLIIKGSLDISGSRIEFFPTLQELPKNLTVAGHINGYCSHIKAIPEGLNANVSERAIPSDFSRSALETIGKDAVFWGEVDFSNSKIRSIVGKNIKPLESWTDKETGDFELRYERLHANAIDGVIPTDSQKRVNMAVSTDTPSVLSALAVDELDAVRVAVASNVNTPCDVIEEMAKNEKAGCVIEAIEKNPYTYYVSDFADVEDYGQDIRYNIAANPNTPPNILAKMMKEDAFFFLEGIGEEIAQNPNTPADVLAKLADDNSRIVIRMAVAHNPNTPSELLEKLGKDDEPDVRKWVAHNPNTPSALLEKLGKDGHHHVRSAVVLQLNSSAIPAKIGNIKLTLAQRLALRDGKEVALQGVISRDGKTHDGINASFDREKNRVKLVRAQKEKVKIDPANQVQAIQQTAKQTAAKKQAKTRGRGLK